jgi:VanZ family protein
VPSVAASLAMFLFLWAPVVVYMAAIFYVSSQSSPPAPGGLPDYVLHAIEYFGFAVVVFRAVAGGRGTAVTGIRLTLTLLIALAYAISDEVHQLFVPNRTADVRDVLADMAGAALGLCACWAWHIISAPGSRLQPSKSNVDDTAQPAAD